MKYGELVKLSMPQNEHIRAIPRHVERIEKHGLLYAFQGWNKHGLVIIKSLQSGVKISVLEDWINGAAEGDTVDDAGASGE